MAGGCGCHSPQVQSALLDGRVDEVRSRDGSISRTVDVGEGGGREWGVCKFQIVLEASLKVSGCRTLPVREANSYHATPRQYYTSISTNSCVWRGYESNKIFKKSTYGGRQQYYAIGRLLTIFKKSTYGGMISNSRPWSRGRCFLDGFRASSEALHSYQYFKFSNELSRISSGFAWARRTLCPFVTCAKHHASIWSSAAQRRHRQIILNHSSSSNNHLDTRRISGHTPQRPKSSNSLWTADGHLSGWRLVGVGGEPRAPTSIHK